MRDLAYDPDVRIPEEEKYVEYIEWVLSVTDSDNEQKAYVKFYNHHNSPTKTIIINNITVDSLDLAKYLFKENGYIALNIHDCKHHSESGKYFKFDGWSEYRKEYQIGNNCAPDSSIKYSLYRPISEFKKYCRENSIKNILEDE